MKNTVMLKISKTLKLQEEQKVQIESYLKEIFEGKKLYLEPQISLHALSQETRLSPNLLSTFFNRVLGVHYNDYINRLRIQYFNEMLENKDVSHFTLAGLATTCGFHNRNTFTTAFKKFVGITPSRYLRLIQDDNKLKKVV